MYCKMSNGKYNLEKVVRIQHLKDEMKFGYKYVERDIPEKRCFFGLFVSKPAKPVGYYQYDYFDGLLEPVSKEEAVYGPNMIKIWFVGDECGREWTMESEEQALELIALCEQSSSACKANVTKI